MSYYAKTGELRQSEKPIEGYIPITPEQYLEVLAGKAEGKDVYIDADGAMRIDYPPKPEPVPTPDPEPKPEPTIEESAEIRREAIDMAHAAALAEGMPYTIAGQPDVVQTRPQDQINLLGLSSKAQRLIAAADTTTLMPFRGLSNKTYMLTAQQMDTLALDAFAYIEDVYQHSWDCKDAIDQALDAGDRAAIEAVTW